MRDQDWVRKAVAVGISIPAVIAVVAWTALGRTDRGPEELPTYWDAPPFALVDQAGDTLRSDALLGQPWVASFVFTNCAGLCPLISARMAHLRDSLQARGWLGDVRLVSFTVDPARDTPPVLRSYAERFGSSPPEAWAFLTGSPPTAVRALVQEGFRLAAVAPETTEEAPSSGEYQVNHSPRVLLVDAEGLVRGIYQGTDPDTPSRIVTDLTRLVTSERRGR